MTDTLTTQKDLELLDDLVPAEEKPAEPVADAAKPAEKESAKGESLFDGLDDDAGKGADKPKAKPADGEASDDKAKPADGDDAKGKEDSKAEAGDDAAWRERAIDKILAPLKDKLSQAKFEKRREQLLGQFKRYKTQDDAIISGVMAQEKIRSGEHKKLSEDASPEEAAAWRKENDIPEDSAKYDIPAIAGHTWKEADEPVLAGFKAAAHEANLPQSAVNRLTKWWVDQQQTSEAEYDSKLKALDRQDKEACHDALRTEFGISEFKPSLSVMKRLLEDPEVFGEDMAEILVGSRFFDEETGMWRRLTSHPSFARGLIGIATERYGDGAMAAGDGRTSATANRLDEIEKILKTDADRYYREGLADEAMAIRMKQEEREQKRAARGAR